MPERSGPRRQLVYGSSRMVPDMPALKANGRVTLAPGETATDILGHQYRPVLDREGKVIVRPTRDGDLFLANSRHVRIVKCTGGLFRGLTRQIVEKVPASETTRPERTSA